MNSTIILSINGYKRNILRYNYSFSRKVDYKGRPTTGLLGGSIDIEIESDGNSSILDMMLADMNKPRPAFFLSNEPIPISGKIQYIKDDMMFRELVFNEAYLYYYGEDMKAEGSEPMTTRFLISPTRLDINRTVRLDRRIKTTYGFWWEEEKEEEEKKAPVKMASCSPPVLLVTSVKGKVTALSSEEIEYRVTGYSLSTVGDSDRKRVKWVIKINGKEEVQNEHGEVLKLLIKKEWVDKEIAVMPYLKKPSSKVCQKTKITACKHVDGAVAVAQYIVDEIKTNTKSEVARSIRYYASEEEYKKRYEEWRKRGLLGQILSLPESQNLIKAKVLWTEKVFSERPWDHKPPIRNKFNFLAIERTEYSNKTHKMVTYRSHWHKYKDYDYYYDVWSNIHYGYVGLSVGFDKKTLLGSADLAQLIDSSGDNAEDTGDDKTSIKIGFALYYKYGRYAEGLTAQDILDALDSSMMTESKRKHVCLEK